MERFQRGLVAVILVVISLATTHCAPSVSLPPTATSIPAAPNQATTLLQSLPPTPENTLEGATVQDGPFTFDLRLYRKPEFGRNPPAPWMYSDLAGIGSHMMWAYHGAGMEGPVKEYWGIQPNLTFLSAYSSLKDGDNSGRQGGVLLPDQSQANDRVQLVLKLETPQGTYGGSISFTLQQGRDGFEPVEVTIAPLTSNPPPGAEVDFPLALNNTWVFQLTRYEGVPITEIITTTLVVTETVVEVKSTSSYFVAKIHREESAEVPVGEVPPSWQGVPLRPATSSDYWLVVSGNRMYRQERNLDLSSLSTALLEFVFPVKLGEKWYRSDEKARLSPTYADDWMLRKVTKVGTVVVPAGEFNDCFFLQEEWAGYTAETWFCPNVGIVDEKGNHHGTPEGFRQVLIRYQLNK